MMALAGEKGAGKGGRGNRPTPLYVFSIESNKKKKKKNGIIYVQ